MSAITTHSPTSSAIPPDITFSDFPKLVTLRDLPLKHGFILPGQEEVVYILLAWDTVNWNNPFILRTNTMDIFTPTYNPEPEGGAENPLFTKDLEVIPAYIQNMSLEVTRDLLRPDTNLVIVGDHTPVI